MTHRLVLGIWMSGMVFAGTGYAQTVKQGSPKTGVEEQRKPPPSKDKPGMAKPGAGDEQRKTPAPSPSPPQK